ncbi:MAG: hypothetical protein CHACPFDD_03648 [Phycisphaerae bacterium]|nr:hypothetical protein [Phycisphaerae bacterium]
MLVALAIAATCGERAGALQQTLYRVTGVGDLPGGHLYSLPYAVSDTGLVTGIGNREDYGNNAYLWQGTDALWDLESLDPPDAQSIGEGVNNLGHVCGVSETTPNGDEQAFLWTPEAGMIGLGDLPGGSFYSWAHGINDLDEVVGLGRIDSDYGAFLWTAGTGMIYLGDLPGGEIMSNALAINNRSEVTGYSVSSRTALGEAFIWDAVNGMRSLGSIPGGGYLAEGQAINNLGQIAGPAATPEGKRACVWDPQTGFKLLGVPEGFASSDAWGMNDVGQVVGQCAKPFEMGQRYEGWVWDEQYGMQLLTPLLGARKPAYLKEVRWARDINNRGQIVCSIRGSNEGFLLTPFVLGDLNCDGAFDAFDIAPFVDALLDKPAHDALHPDCPADWVGDMNQDGSFNGFDVDAFVELLAGGG